MATIDLYVHVGGGGGGGGGEGLVTIPKNVS